MNIGNRIKERRKQLGMSAETLADRIGKSPATIYRYEKGDIDKVDSRIIPKIAMALSVDPAYIMGWETNSDSASSSLSDPKEAELLQIYRDLNPRGQDALIRQARYLRDDPEMKNDSASNITAV